MAVAIVTGAGSGIGAATARALSERGDQVVCADVKVDTAKATASKLRDAVGVEVDVSSSASNDQMVEEAVRRFGDVHSIVTCAGVEKHGPAHEFAEEDFVWIIDVNLKGTWLSARSAVRTMIKLGRATADGYPFWAQFARPLGGPAVPRRPPCGEGGRNATAQA